METRADYGVLNSVKIRPETLTPANSWTQPKPEEIKKILELAGLTGGDAAELLGLTPQGNKNGRGSRTVRRWTAGDISIPYAPWAILAYQAGFGVIWK